MPSPVMAEALRRAADDRVGWLTTVTDAGLPSPTPVWFVVAADGTLVVFTSPTARKVANIGRRPGVAFHLNCSPAGGGVLVVSGTARVGGPARPSAEPGYADKYAGWIARRGMTAEEFDDLSPARIAVRPHRLWRGPGALSAAGRGGV
ncbi:pyridoxamine 5'-phosphate oxidase family protein [Streptomyces sp. NPDC004031]